MNNVFKLTTTNIPTVGTFGTLTDTQGQEIARTVEREWLNNEPSISCIPAGLYELIKRDSPKYGEAKWYMVNKNLGVTINDASQRTVCLWHVANWPHELQGCIAPGMAFNNSKWGVYQSRKAIEIVEAAFDKIADESQDGKVFLQIIRNNNV